MRQRGFTLLEVIIASVIMAAVLTAVYSVLFASDALFEKELQLRDAQLKSQTFLEDVSEEVKETSSELMKVQTFTDPDFQTLQTILIFPSARNDDGKFQTMNGQADWQRLVIYAPFFNQQSQRGELRRYVSDVVPGPFTTEGSNPTVTINADTLFLESLVLQRSDGAKVLDKLTTFFVDNTGTAAIINVNVQGNISLNQQTQLQSGIRGRN